MGDIAAYEDIDMYHGISKWIWPCLELAGLSAPVVSILFSDSIIERNLQMHKDFIVMSLVLLWVFGMLLFGASQFSEASLMVCKDAARSLIRIDLKKPFSVIKWDIVIRKYQKLGSLFENLWSLSRVGGVWVLRVLSALVLSILAGVCGMAHPHPGARHYFRIVGVLFGVVVAALLFRLAGLTTLCMDRRNSSGSICNGARMSWKDHASGTIYRDCQCTYSTWSSR